MTRGRIQMTQEHLLAGEGHMPAARTKQHKEEKLIGTKPIQSRYGYMILSDLCVHITRFVSSHCPIQK